MQKRGHEVEPVLAQTKLTLTEVMKADSRIPCALFGNFFAIASRESQDRCFGLKVGESGSPVDIGLLGYIILHSPNLYEAIINATRFLRVHDEGTHNVMHSDGETTTLEIVQLEHRIEDARQVSEFDLSVTVSMIRSLVGDIIPITKVEIRHEKISRSSIYKKVFGVEPQFNATRNALTLPTSFLLETPLIDADDKLLKILKTHGKNLLAKSPDRADLIGQIRVMIIEELSDGVLKSSHIAKRLAMSDRTLSRRLAEEGKGFRDILDETRHHLAIEYIQELDLRLSEVAFLLGYSEVSSFIHAFKRWTGKTPSEYRSL